MARSRRHADVNRLDDVISSLSSRPVGASRDATPDDTPAAAAAAPETIVASNFPIRKRALAIGATTTEAQIPPETRPNVYYYRRYNPRRLRQDDQNNDDNPSSNFAATETSVNRATGTAAAAAAAAAPPKADPALVTSKSDPGPCPSAAETSTIRRAADRTADLERRLKEKDAQINHLIDKLDSRDEQIEELRAKIDKIQSLLLIVEVRKKFGSDLCISI